MARVEVVHFGVLVCFCDRREFGHAVIGAASAGILGSVAPANAEVFFDPAMYGDQELRVGTVDSVRERTRRAILRNPKLAPEAISIRLFGPGVMELTKDNSARPVSSS